jgi:hypothetical protein
VKLVGTIDMPRTIGIVRNITAVILFGIALNASSMAIAGPRGPLEGEPTRSYGAIDVVMYQTSW